MFIFVTSILLIFRIVKKIFGIIFLILNSFFAFSQDFPYELPNYYPFINYEADSLSFCGDSTAFYQLFEKFKRLILKGEGKINVVQIGDSHIQADFFSGQMRERLQNFAGPLNAGRGFIFPYRMAKSNNPHNFATKFTGKWENCKNVDWRKVCKLGLAGIMVKTSKPDAEIEISLRKNFDFNKVKIFQELGENCFEVKFTEISPIDTIFNDSLGFVEYYFAEHQNSLTLKIVKTSPLQKNFTLYGFEFSSDDIGIIYHSLGVNGADVESFLRCQLLENHLLALSPDWVIISLGTNDAATRHFSAENFASNIRALIAKIRNVTPNAAILLTVPADCFYRRRQPSKNIPLAEEAIFRVAKECKCAVFDLYAIMGGKGSMALWQKAGLAAWDKTHFSTSGYILQGNLLFNAFLQKFDNFIDFFNSKNTKK